VSLGDITTREQLVLTLTDAAELEHAVICQYLFAAHSLKSHPSEPGVNAAQLERIREWQADILAVARGEMEHLGLVCNLLSAIGGTPYFRREDLPRPGQFAPPHVRFELLPFSPDTLKKFMQFEALHAVLSKDGKPGYDTIGDLYDRIRRGFEALDDGGALFVGNKAAQITNQTIDLNPGWHDLDLVAVANLKDALSVLDQIIEAGHDPESDGKPTHYDRFANTLKDLKAWRRSDPGFEPTRPVSANPITRVEAGAFGDTCTPIDHAVTRKAAVLFNAAYEAMTLMLTRYYTPTDETPEEHAAVGKTAIYPLMTVTLRPLAEMLTQMPASESSPERTAGPTFEFYRDESLPAEKRVAWVFLQGRLDEMVGLSSEFVGDVAAASESWAETIKPRLQFMHENLESTAVRFGHYMKTRLG